MKLFKVAATLLLSASLLTACGGGNTAAPGTSGNNAGGDSDGQMVIKIANITKENNAMSKAAYKIAEEVEAKTNGRITFEHFHAGQLGNEADMMQQLNTNGIQMGIITTAQLSNSSDAFGAWLLPFIVETQQQAYELAKSEESMALFDTLTQDNVHGLGYISAGFRYFLSTKPIEGLKDLENMKLRTTPSPTILDFMNEMKVSPTPMPLTEVYTSLQTGVIDGVDIDTEGVVSESLTEIAKHMTPSNHMYWQSTVLMNKDVWNSLSDEDKRIFEEAVDVAMQENIALLEKNEKELVENGPANLGITVHQLSNRAEFDPIIQAVYDKWSAKSPEIGKFIEKAKEITNK